MIFYGSSARHLKQSDIKQAGLEIKKTVFPDGEISIFFDARIENKVVTYFQSTASPVNDRLMELLITVNAFQQQFAEKIILLMPYFGYSRQDRLDDNCSAISAKVVAQLIGHSGIDKLITLDLHTPQLTGFFPIPVQDLSALPLLAQYITHHFRIENCRLVSPDIGGLKRVNDLAALLSLDVAIIDKKRSNGHIQSGYIIGNVRDKICLLIDDLIDSGKTLIAASEKLHTEGATEIHALATHGLFSGNAIQALQASRLKSIVVTNSIDTTRLSGYDKFNIIDIRAFLHQKVPASQCQEVVSVQAGSI